LELPTHTIYTSQTQPGDQLLICAVEEIANRFNKASVTRLKSQTQRFDTDMAYTSVEGKPNLFEIKK
jgi:hypothetical protein